jgi:hypothetical protein
MFLVLIGPVLSGHVLKGGVESWSGVLETPSEWSLLSWSVVFDFSVDVFCKLGIDK